MNTSEYKSDAFPLELNCSMSAFVCMHVCMYVCMHACIHACTWCSELRLIGHWLTRVIKTEQSTIEHSITLYGVTMTDSLIRWSPNEWTSVCREITQCLTIRYSGRLINLHNEHSICVYVCICMCECIYVCMYVCTCMYVCMYVCRFIHITFTRNYNTPSHYSSCLAMPFLCSIDYIHFNVHQIPGKI
jgi:hypothetical protein